MHKVSNCGVGQSRPTDRSIVMNRSCSHPNPPRLMQRHPERGSRARLKNASNDLKCHMICTQRYDVMSDP